MDIRYAIGAFVLMSNLCNADIEGCIEGNTCYLKEPQYTGNVRLLCIKAPALTEPLGVEARDALRAEVHGTIKVLFAHMDKDDVPVAELVWDDGLNLGLHLIGKGLAKVAQGGCEEMAYVIAENDARKAGIGLWGVPVNSPRFSCPGPRYCKQVDSCDQAMFLLMNCKRLDFDRDKDGVPCENICPGG